ncbi:MAG: CotS family spore coat protein [Lachnospiraceae bacterium]
MKEYGLSVLEQYNIEVYSTRKTRGAVLCDTKQGLLLLKEITFSPKRIPLLYKLCTELEAKDISLVDTILPNLQGEYMSTAEDQGKYILKKWFSGKECDVRKENEILETTRNLARLHQKLEGIIQQMELTKEEMLHLNENNLMQEYVRHEREMKKVRSFMRDKVAKGDFELLFLKNFEEMYGIAKKITEKLYQSNYQELYHTSIQKNCITHGDYNYHNVIMTNQGAATTNFEHFQIGIQVSDFYYFLRKVMEKCRWKTSFGKEIIKAYDDIKPLKREEYEYIAIRLAYPEKYWKMANSYYYSNKAWIPAKNVEKLNVVIEQNTVKSSFLKDIFSFIL